MKTKALCFIQPGKVEVLEKELPPISNNDVLVKVYSCGVCKGDIDAYNGFCQYPYFGGHEGSGIVEDIGSEVTRFRPGDHVAMLGDGRFSAYTVAKEHQVVKLPDMKKNWAEWILEPLACCVNGVEVASIAPDDVVGVIGCGYMGLGLLQCLKISPARLRIAMDIRDDRLDLAKSYGADEIIRADSPDLLDRVEAIIQRRPMRTSYIIPASANGPFDVVFEASGSKTALNIASKLLRVGGKLIMFGHQRGETIIDGTLWHMNGLHVLNTSPMIAIDFYQTFYRSAGLLERDLITNKGLITHTATLEEADKLFMRTRESTYVKGALLTQPSDG